MKRHSLKASPAARRAAPNPYTQRHQRVTALLHKTLSEILARPDPLHAPRISEARLTITRLELSSDLNHARVKVLPLAASTEGIHSQVAPQWTQENINSLNSELARSARSIRKQLGRKLALKRTPKLDLQFDHATLRTRELETKLARMAEHREQSAQ